MAGIKPEKITILRTVDLEIGGEFGHKKENDHMGDIMDTSNFDAAARQHLNVYKNFLTFSKVSIIATVTVLVLMAIFLL